MTPPSFALQRAPSHAYPTASGLQPPVVAVSCLGWKRVRGARAPLSWYLVWWQVLGSNQRRLSRRFYRPLPLATRATCQAPPCEAAERRIADNGTGCDADLPSLSVSVPPSAPASGASSVTFGSVPVYPDGHA